MSDERLPLVVLDMRKLKAVEGRVLGHGEEEDGRGAGRHYMLLEGTDAKIHLIYYTPEMEAARSRGQLRANSFVRLQKQFENARPELHVESYGDADRFLQNRQHLKKRADDFLKQEASPPSESWGGWLGRYHEAICETAANINELKSSRPPGRRR